MQKFSINADIDDRSVAEARKYIGVPMRIQQFNHEATIDTIRHYCNGIGDDNPLYTDPDYAEKSAYGSLIAPPTFFYSVFSAGITPGFEGVQAFFGSGRFDIKRLPKRGEAIKAEARLKDIVEKAGKRAKRMAIQIGEVEYRTADGELLATYISNSLRVPRADREGGLRYEPRETRRYTEDELAAIEAEVIAETRRGAETRYFEDVSVAEQLPTRVKGPLNMASYMAYYAGNLGGIGYTSTELQWKLRHAARHNPGSIPNNRSLDWLIEETWPGVAHTNDQIARSVGMPGAYDNGWNRVGWMGHLVTDWMGDDGHLAMIEVRAVAPNIMGDTLWCRGTVVNKRVEGGRHIVSIDLSAENQDKQLSCTGKAEVVLPSRPV
ncbi:MaoC_dehydrat_N domain-containing protein [Hyphomicrobiales bacterium]|nr:MaoC_dehydrat_N domain-containing protein [Hyphomicrobiales bacterium]CAH1692143.1 MaoC_dehydrat_N domain-containing protein [Hyphomicrobiales bacterium]